MVLETITFKISNCRQNLIYILPNTVLTNRSSFNVQSMLYPKYVIIINTKHVIYTSSSKLLSYFPIMLYYNTYFERKMHCYMLKMLQPECHLFK